MSASARSYNNHSNNTRVADTRSDKKFCGVCQKKGLPESVYTSHFTKSVPSDKGLVTCPTILNASCTYCHGKGHWADPKFCSVMRKDRKASARMEAPTVSAAPAAGAPTVSAAPAAKKSDTIFSRDDFPTIGAGSRAASLSLPSAGVSWASITSRPALLAPDVIKPKTKPLENGFVVLSRATAAATDSASGSASALELAHTILNERMHESVENTIYDEDECYDDCCEDAYGGEDDYDDTYEDNGRSPVSAWDD